MNENINISIELISKIGTVNKDNPYADITPFALQVGYPYVHYRGIILQPDEVMLYAVPANVFNDKERVVGYTGGSAGVSVRVTKGVSIKTSSSKGKAVRSNVREYNNGDLVITNKKVIFVASMNGFEIPVKKITATKILTKQSFIIQVGNSSKNISMEESLTAYVLTMIEHVTDSNIRGVDLFKNYHLVQDNMTLEQINMCREVKERAHNICAHKIKEKRKKKGFLLLLGAVVLIIFLMIIGSMNERDVDKTGNNELRQEANIPETNYSDEEIVSFEKHPRICDTLESGEKFVEFIGDRRIQVMTTAEYNKFGKDKSNIIDNAVVYMIANPLQADYIGRIIINIYEEDFAANMTIDKAVEIMLSYLPKNFLEIYKLDRAYIRENEKAIIYTYATRLNEAGIEFHNNGNKQYSYYLSFYISYYKESGNWGISCDYSAYGDKGIDWIEKYAAPWEINLNQ